VLQNPNLFPAFRVESGFILCLNDLRVPEVIHKGGEDHWYAIKNAHKINRLPQWEVWDELTR